MAQFDVFETRDGELVIDLQTDLLGSFDTRIVAPLMLVEHAPVRHPRLNPEVIVDGVLYVMVTQFLIAVDRPELGRRKANVGRDYDRIKAAYDMPFNGF